MKRKQPIIAILACLVFLLDGLTIAACWMQTQNVQQRLEKRHQTIELTEKLESNAQRLGSYVHRFALTANESFLQEYYRAEAKVQSLLDNLVTLTKSNELQEHSLVSLQNAIAERFLWEHKILSTYNSNGKDAALYLIQTSGGAPIMDRLRSQLKDMENTEKLLLQNDSRDCELYRSASLAAIVLLTITGGIALWQAIEMFSRSKSLEADRILAYERLEEMNKQLNKQVSELLKAQQEANDALTVRSQFLARISHELRTPLAGIIGATELALETKPGNEQRELIETAKRSSNILLELVNDILDFEKLEQQKLKLEESAFDLPLAIKSALEPIKMKANDKGIAFRVDIASDTPRLVYSDRLRIQQVLVNLADNATKFTDKGEVTVKVTVEKRDSTRAIVCFNISDTGIGIKDDLIEQIWEPFNQTNGFAAQKYGGSGLGLSISKRLVEALHGRIQVSSIPDHGSQFKFMVPLALNQSLPQKPEPQQRSPIAKAASILVVDDSLTICKVTAAQLEALDFSPELATSGEEAIECTRTKHFDLILMDIQMPVMNGIETAWMIRSSPDNLCRDVPIIAYTAHAMPGDQEKYLAAGLSDYLAKPVTLAGLRHTLEKWINLKTPIAATLAKAK